jgi:NAD(P)-dependent dehydrogenase (short-subunit alcohol dehydrogenase family)
MNAARVWFVTGSNRGLGLDIVRAALARGDRVVATARTPQGLREAVGDTPGFVALPVDVTSPAAVNDAVAEATDRFGRIDVLVNNAGRGLLGGVEEITDREARAVFDVNVFGLLTVTRAVLPVMRAQRSGTIINISSSGGFVARAGWGVYSATKFAVEGISEALGHELAPLGIPSRAGYGAPDWQVDAWVSTYTAIADNSMARVTTAVHDITGAPAMSLDDYLHATPARGSDDT